MRLRRRDIDDPEVVGFLVQIRLDHRHAFRVRRKDRLVVEVPGADDANRLALPIEHGELAGLRFHDLRDDPRSFDGIPRKLSLAAERGSQEGGARRRSSSTILRTCGHHPPIGQFQRAKKAGVGHDNPQALAATKPVGLANLAAYERKRAPVVVIDAKSGKRWPIWVEIDSNAATPEETAVLIHPAKNFAAGRRYIVAMRNLKTATGATIPAPEGFTYYRDDLRLHRARDQQPPRALRAHLQRASRRRRSSAATSTSPGTSPSPATATSPGACSTFATTPSSSSATRNLADLKVQGGSPSFAVDEVTELARCGADGCQDGEDPNVAREIRGSFTVPCYLEPDCDAGGRFRPRRQGAAEPERHLDRELQLHRARPPSTAVDRDRQPARRLRPRAPGQRRRGVLERAADARGRPRLRLLRHRRDRVLRERHPEHHRHPPGPLDLPRAHRPGPAGPAERALPRAADDPQARLRLQRRLPSEQRRRRQPVGARQLAALLQRQQPGRDPRRRR